MSKLQSFKRYFTSLDSYGKPVKVSYKGDSTYKTFLGASMTMAMKVFMLFFILTSTINLIDYKNPQITQYQVYDSRSDGREVNLGESHGDLLFGFFNVVTRTYEEPDPRIASFRVQLISFNWANVKIGGNIVSVKKELALEQVTAETRPFLFDKGSPLDVFESVEGLYSIVDRDDVTLINNNENIHNQFLRFEVRLCTTSEDSLGNSQECAP